MVDLHLHLDGSFDAADILKASKEACVDIGNLTVEDIRKKITYNSQSGNLTDYLKCFELPLKVMQSAETVRYAVMKLLERLRADSVNYAEIRFAPQLHTFKGMTQRQVVVSACEALEYGQFIGVNAKLILCMMRGKDNFKENEVTVETAYEFLGNGVAALDLAGDESQYKTHEYADLFKYASDKKIPFTIHAGEADGAKSVEDALRFGAVRIGHGLAASNDMELMRYMSLHDIGVEVCPVSNMQTMAVSGYDKYPLFVMLENGVAANINTDNRTVSDTNMSKEFSFISKIEGYRPEYADLIKKNAMKIRF